MIKTLPHIRIPLNKQPDQTPELAELVADGEPVEMVGEIGNALDDVVVSTPAIAQTEVDHADLPIVFDARI